MRLHSERKIISINVSYRSSKGNDTERLKLMSFPISLLIGSLFIPGGGGDDEGGGDWKVKCVCVRVCVCVCVLCKE